MKNNPYSTGFWAFLETFTPDIQAVGVDSLDCINQTEWEQVAVTSFLAPFLDKRYKFDTLEDFQELLSSFLVFSDEYLLDFYEYLISGDPYYVEGIIIPKQRIPNFKVGGWGCKIYQAPCPVDEYGIIRAAHCVQILYLFETQKIKIDFFANNEDGPEFPDDFPDLIQNFFIFCEVNQNADG